MFLLTSLKESPNWSETARITLWTQKFFSSSYGRGTSEKLLTAHNIFREGGPSFESWGPQPLPGVAHSLAGAFSITTVVTFATVVRVVTVVTVVTKDCVTKIV